MRACIEDDSPVIERRDLDRLADMRDALTDIRALTANGKQVFESDRVAQQAVAYNWPSSSRRSERRRSFDVHPRSTVWLATSQHTRHTGQQLLVKLELRPATRHDTLPLVTRPQAALLRSQ